MANIRKVEGKTGTAYKITVFSGTDAEGRQVRHYRTWKPEPGMTARQIEKAVQRAAVDFERELELGYQADNRQTFAQYAEYVMKLKERAGLKPKWLLCPPRSSPHQPARLPAPVCQAHDKKIFPAKAEIPNYQCLLIVWGFCFISHSTILSVMHGGLSLLVFSENTSVVAPHSSQ